VYRIAQIVESHGLVHLNRAELDALKDSSAEKPMIGGQEAALYTRSLHRIGPALLAMARIARGESLTSPVCGSQGGGDQGYQKRLVVVSDEQIALGFDGPTGQQAGLHYQEVIPHAKSCRKLWELVPWTRPCSLRSERTTIGMGDRLGMATAGHIRAIRGYQASPVLAQQSIRELDFTGREFADVVADAAFMVFQEGFDSGYGADGDHLKTIPDIDRALGEQMPMITLDLTETMRPEVADWPQSKVEAAFERLPDSFRRRVEESYAGRSFELETARITMDAPTAHRCAVMYGDSLAFSEEVDAHLKRATGDAYDLEISIDETTTPTLPSHHYFIARELESRGVTVNSVAPRFIGDFQKAVDYIGDQKEFASQFRVHAEIARATGGFKVSVHSGSDKFSVYPVVGRETAMRLHLKTSGTSWLESLRTIAQTAPDLYRSIHRRALEYFPTALKSYHITADLDAIPPLEKITDEELPLYLNQPDCRQLLHISYGGILQDPELRVPFHATLLAEEEPHVSNVHRHLEKHLSLLGVPPGT
jgi:hypothetical protein